MEVEPSKGRNMYLWILLLPLCSFPSPGGLWDCWGVITPQIPTSTLYGSLQTYHSRLPFSSIGKGCPFNCITPWLARMKASSIPELCLVFHAKSLSYMSQGRLHQGSRDNLPIAGGFQAEVLPRCALQASSRVTVQGWLSQRPSRIEGSS